MIKTVNAFNRILIDLCEIQKSAWFKKEEKWKPSKRALKTYDFVESQYQLGFLQPVKSEDIEDLFSPCKPANVNFFKENKVLYLPPMKKDAEDAEFVPIFSLCCNLSRNQSTARFRVMLVTLDQNDKTKLNGIGFRMEPPESRDQNANTTNNDNTGIHDFYHAQLIQQFSPKKFGDILQNKCLSWLPESQPSFPLPADCPVTLLLCIILTLYGWEYYNDFCNRIPITDEYRKKLNISMGKDKDNRK